jgi:hypothetical protein
MTVSTSAAPIDLLGRSEAERLRAETLAAGAVVKLPGLVSAWTWNEST